MTTKEKTPLTVAATALEQPIALLSVPVWSVPDASVVTLDVAADGLSAFAVSVAPGTVTVTVTADGLTATADLTVTAVADKLVITVGTPVAK
jgi:hypothetical protein